MLTKYLTADIWVAFGTGKNYTRLHINAICHSLGNEKSTTLPIFHCYTGCDTMTAFCGKRKKSAWEAWSSYLEVTQHRRLGLPTLRSLSMGGLVFLP